MIRVETVAKILGGIGIAAAGLYWYPRDWLGSAFVDHFYAEIATSLLSISLTVLLIDRLYERREAVTLKQRLLRELGSSDNGFAVRAAKEVRAQGWMADGSLTKCDLSLANLANANFQGAIVIDTNCYKAHLIDANFKGAKFTGGSFHETLFNGATLDDTIVDGDADFLKAEFAGASLRDIQLPGAKLEEAVFFRADLSNANLAGARMRGAKFHEANLDKAILDRANLADIKGWEQIRSMVGASIAAIEDAPAGFKDLAYKLGALGGPPKVEVVNAEGLPAASTG